MILTFSFHGDGIDAHYVSLQHRRVVIAVIVMGARGRRLTWSAEQLHEGKSEKGYGGSNGGRKCCCCSLLHSCMLSFWLLCIWCLDSHGEKGWDIVVFKEVLVLWTVLFGWWEMDKWPSEPHSFWQTSTLSAAVMNWDCDREQCRWQMAPQNQQFRFSVRPVSLTGSHLKPYSTKFVVLVQTVFTVWTILPEQRLYTYPKLHDYISDMETRLKTVTYWVLGACFHYYYNPATLHITLKNIFWLKIICEFSNNAAG